MRFLFCPPTRRLVLGAALLLLAGCDALLPGAPPEEALLAGPIAGLTPPQAASHIAGDEAFARIFTAEDGVGPLFVAASCEACHVGDGKGHPVTMLTRFGRYQDGLWDPMTAQGGPQLQHRALAGYLAETLPPEATGVTQLMAPAVTGLGLLEAVPDALLRDLADPDDADGDGISGRIARVPLPDFVSSQGRHLEDGQAIGRFGKKAGAVDLLHQTVNAYKQDMGVTSPFDTAELFNPLAGAFTGDQVPDPEVSATEVHLVVFYLRTLKPPPRRRPDAAEVRAGERHFLALGCAGCHVPQLQTGPSDVAALSRQIFYPYTDLLLHDMGPALDDGYAEGGAAQAEWRTPPLWGLGLAADAQGGQARYLHDGRATTLSEAIGLHGGEGAASRDAFQALPAAEQAALIAFLESL